MDIEAPRAASHATQGEASSSSPTSAHRRDGDGLPSSLAAIASGPSDERYAHPRNLAVALAVEAGALLDRFKWLSDAEAVALDEEVRKGVAEGAIEALLYAARLASRMGVDVGAAVAERMGASAARTDEAVPEVGRDEQGVQEDHASSDVPAETRGDHTAAEQEFEALAAATEPPSFPTPLAVGTDSVAAETSRAAVEAPRATHAEGEAPQRLVEEGAAVDRSAIADGQEARHDIAVDSVPADARTYADASGNPAREKGEVEAEADEGAPAHGDENTARDQADATGAAAEVIGQNLVNPTEMSAPVAAVAAEVRPSAPPSKRATRTKMAHRRPPSGMVAAASAAFARAQAAAARVQRNYTVPPSPAPAPVELSEEDEFEPAITLDAGPPPVAAPARPIAEKPAVAEEVSKAHAAVATASAPDFAPSAEHRTQASKAEPASDATKGHARLDLEAVQTLRKSLARTLEALHRKDPILRELGEELETLRRTHYANAAKPAWIADTLLTIRRMLEESIGEGLGGLLDAERRIAAIDALLK